MHPTSAKVAEDGITAYIVSANGTSKLQIRAGQWSITANLQPLNTHIYHVMIIVTVVAFSKNIFFN